MPSTSQKEPISLPAAGVKGNLNPRIVGSAGLIDAKNWIFRDGRMTVRDGVVEAASVNDEWTPNEGLVNYFPAAATGDEDDISLLRNVWPFGKMEMTTDEVDPYPRQDATWTAGGRVANLNEWLRGLDIDLDNPWPDGLEAGPGFYTGNPTLEYMETYWHTHDTGTISSVERDTNAYHGSYGNYDWNAEVTSSYNSIGCWWGSSGPVFVVISDEASTPWPVDICMHTPFVPLRRAGSTYQFSIKGGANTTGFDGDKALASGDIKIRPFLAQYLGVKGGMATWGPIEYIGAITKEDLSGDPTVGTTISTTAQVPADSAATHIGFTVWVRGNEFVVLSNAMIAWCSNATGARATPRTYMPPSDRDTDPGEPGEGFVRMGQRGVGIADYPISTTELETVVGTTEGWWVIEPDFTVTDITDATDPLTGDNENQVVFRVFDTSDPEDATVAGKFLIGVNGNDTVKYWNGSRTVPGNYQELLRGGTDSATDEDQLTAKTMCVCGNRIIYGNITLDPEDVAGDVVSFPDGIIYSGYLKTNQWSPLNIIRLGETPGQIVASMEMGDNLSVIYKSDAIYLITATGATVPFRAQLKEANIVGPASPLSVVSIDSALHCYLSSDGDVVMFDGVRSRSLGHQIQAYLKKYMDFDKVKQACGVYNKSRKELTYYFTPNGEEDNVAGIIISLETGSPTLWPQAYPVPISACAYTKIDRGPMIDNLGQEIDQYSDTTIDGFARFIPAKILTSALEDSFVSGDPEGVIYTEDGHFDTHGSIHHTLTTGLNDLGAATYWKTLKEIDHIFQVGGRSATSDTIDISIMGSDFGEVPEDVDTDSIDLTARGPYLSRHRVTGRMFGVRMEGYSTKVLEWLGSDASIEMRGLK